MWVRLGLGIIASIAAIIAIGLAEIRIDASFRGISITWSNAFESANPTSPMWWYFAIAVIVALVIAAVWPSSRSRLSALPPLISAAVLAGFALWGEATREPGSLSNFDSGRASSITGALPGSEDSALSQWFLAGSVSTVTYALMGALIALAVYAVMGHGSKVTTQPREVTVEDSVRSEE